MLPSHQILSASPCFDATDSFTSPQLQTNNPTSNSNTQIDRYEHILQFIEQSKSNLDSDSDDSGPVSTSNNQIADDPLLVNTSSDLPDSSTLKGQRRLPQPDEALNDNRNKRQKLGQPQSSQNHPLKNDLYPPTSSKNWSPQPMATPPLSTTEQSDSGGIVDFKVKRIHIQPIPPFRRKEPLRTQQTQEKPTLLKDKENAPISTKRPSVHFHQQINENDSNDHHQYDDQHPVKQPLQQKVTNGSNGHDNHSKHTQKLSMYCDDDDGNGNGNGNGKTISNHKPSTIPLPSVDVNLPYHRQPHIGNHLAKQQHDLDHHQQQQQQKNDHTPALSDRKHHQEVNELLAPSSTKDQKKPTDDIELTGDIMVRRQMYTIMKKIGHGGSAAVYMVINKKSKEILALKHVATKYIDEEARDIYRNEVNFFAMHQNMCPKMCRMYNYEFDKITLDLNIILDYGEMDFARKLEMEKSRPLNMNFVRYHGQQMVEAVAEIHGANIIHRDLKPSNFILQQGSLKLIDFGISKHLKDGAETVKIRKPTGTPNYMSPESLTFWGKNYTRIGKATDIWALGCILYQMIYGRTPFKGISEDEKGKAICDPKHEIKYPNVVIFPPTRKNQGHGGPGQPTRKRIEVSIGKDAVGILRSCLQRNPDLRHTAKQLLEHPFFRPS